MITVLFQVTEVLRQNTDRVKEIFLSGLRQINGLAQSHEKESTLTFEKVNSAISAHSSSLQEVQILWSCDLALHPLKIFLIMSMSMSMFIANSSSHRLFMKLKCYSMILQTHC